MNYLQRIRKKMKKRGCNLHNTKKEYLSISGVIKDKNTRGGHLVVLLMTSESS